MKTLSSFLLIGSICIFITACPSTSTLHTARPVPKGTINGVVAPNLNFSYVKDEKDSHDPQGSSNRNGNDQKNSGYQTYPNIDASLRYGAAESVDVGFTISSNLMTRLDINWAPILLDNFALSIDPTLEVSVIGFAYGSTGPPVIHASIPILADVISMPEQSLTLAFKPGIMSSTSLEFISKKFEQNYVWTLGSSIGYRFTVTQNLSLLPEFSILALVTDAKPSEALIYNFSWAFLF